MKPLMRYHGAKWKLAPWIISHFPEHHCYVEPFGGSAAVLLNKPMTAREVYNDLNFEVFTLFNVIRDEKMRTELLRLLAMTPYSRIEFDFAKDVPAMHVNRSSNSGYRCGDESAVMIAHALLVRAQMGFGSAGATRGNTGFRLDTARNGTSLQALWNDLPENILSVCERLKNVIIENARATQVMQQHDREDTLIYLDPPYLHDTRQTNNAYAHEMSEREHEFLLELMKKSKSMMIISGYDNDLYNDMLQGWAKSTRQTAASSQNGSATRNEVLWISPNCEQRQINLFGSDV